MKHIAIIGGGSWGTALTIVLAQKGYQIRLWVYEADLVEEVNQKRQNPLFLPGFEIPDTVEATNALPRCLENAEIVLTAIPSHHCRSMYGAMLPYLNSSMIFVSATKGIENKSLLRVSELIRRVVGPAFSPSLAVISGPSFAREVAKGDPTAIVVASQDRLVAEIVQREFSGPLLRLYTSTDVVGVELGGAVKNVIAIAAGVCAGLGFGHNSVAALITRGLAEMTRLALACGGKRETLAGLAGMGDLVLTCTGALSRNRTVGLKLGEGQKLSEIVTGMRMVAEGIMTTKATIELAGQHQVEMPIAQQMYDVLYLDKNPLIAIRELMVRPLKDE